MAPHYPIMICSITRTARCFEEGGTVTILAFPTKVILTNFNVTTEAPHLMRKRMDLSSRELDSTPSSATDLLFDHEQIK